MIRGKRRFLVALTIAGIIAVVEMVGQIWGTGGWTVNGQVALLGLAGFYFWRRCSYEKTRGQDRCGRAWLTGGRSLWSLM